ncbi:hypothetical protein IEO21_08246 [Rhodonia placenta]|uniref:Protein kinase domain-containing protein n=1 Tax=Rhodonia placenta TaxID=104341 RepID=A0A8H7TZL3_9APHY|nr:hypothetical protein IEO21_08246 [Postia placenta]
MGSETLSIQDFQEFVLLTVTMGSNRKAKAEVASHKRLLTIHAANRVPTFPEDDFSSYQFYDATLLSAEGQTIHVFLKVSRGDSWRNQRLMKEAWAYGELKDIQGQHIPTCFGLYGRGFDYCLVLEHCGKSIMHLNGPDTLRTLSWDTKRAIMQSLQAIHRKHMVHHNITLTEPNIVIDEASSSVRFIGLGRAYHLTCGFRGDINQEFGKNEEISIGCDELQKLGRYMWIWLPAHALTWQEIKTGDVEKLLNNHPPPEYWTRDEAREDIRRAIREYHFIVRRRETGE